MIRVETQALLDGFAAAGLAAYVAALLVRRVGGPLTPRLVFLFGVMSVFYGVRSLAVRTGLPIFEGATYAAISLAPLAALLLAEGLLRRHAPRAMKIAIFAASALGLGFALFTTSHVAFGSRLALAAIILSSLVAILILLWARDRKALSRAENGAVRRLAVGLAIVIPLIGTDFSELVASPIGFSPIAALVIVLLALSNGVSDARDVWIDAVVIVATTLALTCGLIEQLDVGALDDRVRLFALVGAALITMALVVRIQPFGAAGRRTRLRQRMTSANTRSLDGFLGDLTKEPMLKDLLVLSEHDLADYRPEAMAQTLDRQPLWSAAALQAGAEMIDEAEREPLLDLLARSDATHVGLLSRSPVQIGLVRLPDLLRNTEAEIDLALAFRMARLTTESRP
ncbi:hypothetical protein GCM10017620_30130 [Brevundimonas intermedia]|uniref:Uncharacterized protein n=1 Tax=Brevundimonas intermedia TaxID=74315 RepID=A0ABQ5TDF2_9CAUL|nr:hypothetical protein [Brevundimonas intermedia]GLK50039.1 hypothetical protein GCM10017620_30130 [Brevundimonas intermedia]